MGIWAFLDLCLLAAGVVSVALSIAWRAPNLMLNLVLTDANLTAGTVLGIFLLITFVISIGAIVQRNHVTFGLAILNWTLLIDALGIIIIGTFVWFFTLRERANYHAVWLRQTPETRLKLQDTLKCCGYFETGENAEIGGSVCVSQSVVAEFVANNKTCIGPITKFADTTLNNIFTTVYGFMAIVIGLFLASMCVINKRVEAERFKRIDAKRGGRGFV
jgi:hypothetical protein